MLRRTGGGPRDPAAPTWELRGPALRLGGRAGGRPPDRAARGLPPGAGHRGGARRWPAGRRGVRRPAPAPARAAEPNAVVRWNDAAPGGDPPGAPGPHGRRPRPRRPAHVRVRRVGRLRPGRGGHPDRRRPPAARRATHARGHGRGRQPRPHRALADLFPAEAALFADVLAGSGYDPAGAPAVAGTPRAVGEAAAAAVLAFRHGDGANQLGDLAPAPGRTPTPPATPRSTTPTASSTPTAGSRCVCPTGAAAPPSSAAPPRTGARSPPSRWPPGPSSGRPPARVPLRGLPGAGRAAARLQRRPERRAQGDRRVLGRRAGERDAPGALVPLRPVGLAARRPRPGRRRGAVLRPGQRPAGRQHRLLGLQAAVDYVRPVTAIRHLFGGQAVRAWAGPGRGTGTIDGAAWAPYRAQAAPSRVPVPCPGPAQARTAWPPNRWRMAVTGRT